MRTYEAFRALAARLDEEMAAGSDRAEHLSGPAVRALRASPEVLTLHPGLALAELITSGAELPEQGWANNFGAPSITVVSRTDYRLDLIYWPQNAAPIHKHVSCGAFMALSGRRMHISYAFHGGRAREPYAEEGSLELRRTELLRRGDTRAITPDLIHELYWIEKPAVTVAVRCAVHPGPRERPLDFATSGLALLPPAFQREANADRLLAGLRLLRRSSPDLYWDTLSQVLRLDAPLSLLHYAVDDAVDAGPRRLLPLLEKAAADRRDDLLQPIIESVPEMYRRRLFGRLYAPDDTTQLVAALLWSGLLGPDLDTLLRAECAGEPARTLQEHGTTLIGLDPAVRPFLAAAVRSVS